MLRRSPGFFALSTIAALGLRFWLVFQFPAIYGDSSFYADLAQNWLLHGILGATEATGPYPSIIRLPGYPAFLASIWAVTGVGHYQPVLVLQALFDVGSCFLVADVARRSLRSERGAKIAFLLAALCPFTANYAACVLTETLAIFFAVLALDLALVALDSGHLRHWAACGAAIAAGILMRPDGGIILATTGAYLFVRGCRRTIVYLRGRSTTLKDVARLSFPWILRTAVLGMVALAPLVPWTVRNWRDFHVLQPLAPRYANNPGQFVGMGFQRWVKTWIVDYVSVSELYWPIDGEEVDLSKAPRRAFDSEQERQAVEKLFATYNDTRDWNPELDAQLDKIAQVRILRHPWRYYLWLPAARIADMWLRPRTEMLGLDDRWWQVRDDPRRAFFGMALGAVNLFYIVVAAFGAIHLLSVWSRRRTYEIKQSTARTESDGVRSEPSLLPEWPYWGLLVTFVVVRSLFLGTLENPEPRYTLECYPVVIVFAAAALAQLGSRGTRMGSDQTKAAIGEAQTSAHMVRQEHA